MWDWCWLHCSCGWNGMAKRGSLLTVVKADGKCIDHRIVMEPADEGSGEG